jgi:hypothetical protein
LLNRLSWGNYIKRRYFSPDGHRGAGQDVIAGFQAEYALDSRKVDSAFHEGVSNGA